MVATKAYLIFTNEQGNQVSSIQVEKVYMGYPLKAALKNLLKEEFTLDSIHLPNRSSTFYLSHEYCLPHYFHCQLFENKCNRESQCQSQFTTVWVPAPLPTAPHIHSTSGVPGSSDGKVSAYNAGDLGSVPGLGRFPGKGNSNPLQYSCLENPMDGGAWFRLLSMGSQRVGHDWATSLFRSPSSAG